MAKRTLDELEDGGLGEPNVVVGTSFSIGHAGWFGCVCAGSIGVWAISKRAQGF